MINLYEIYNKPMLLLHYNRYCFIITELINNGICDENHTLNWSDIEPAIKKSAGYSWAYANYVLKQRWVEGEPIIISSPYWAYMYTEGVIKDRWIEAEPIIMKDPLCAYKYAKYILKERWIDAEPYIKKDSYYWNAYKNIFDV
jgi:hypothetical protein